MGWLPEKSGEHTAAGVAAKSGIVDLRTCLGCEPFAAILWWETTVGTTEAPNAERRNLDGSPMTCDLAGTMLKCGSNLGLPLSRVRSCKTKGRSARLSRWANLYSRLVRNGGPARENAFPLDERTVHRCSR